MNQNKSSNSLSDDKQPPISDVLVRLSVFALVRTALSSERALMGWMRTSVSLYTFGFTLSKFFDYLEKEQQSVQSFSGPRRLGLAIICLGMLVLVPSAVEHLRRIRKMKTLGLPRVSLFSLPVAAAVALFGVGFTALIGIILN